LNITLVRVLILLCGAGWSVLSPVQTFAQLPADTAGHSRVAVQAQRLGGTERRAADTLQGADTVAYVQKAQPFQPNPKKAGLYSSIVPGLGQFYNRQYWKIPVVYVGLAVVGYYFIKNLNEYQDYRIAYIGRINNPYPTDKYVNIYTTGQLQQLQNDYNKYLDLTVLFGTIGYAMQVMDAVTAAHLKNFDISRDISLRAHPILVPNGAGVGLVVAFK